MYKIIKEDSNVLLDQCYVFVYLFELQNHEKFNYTLMII